MAHHGVGRYLAVGVKKVSSARAWGVVTLSRLVYMQERNKRIKALQDEAHERERDYSVQSRLKDDLNRTLQEQNRALESKRADLAGINKELRENLTVSTHTSCQRQSWHILWLDSSSCSLRKTT